MLEVQHKPKGPECPSPFPPAAAAFPPTMFSLWSEDHGTVNEVCVIVVILLCPLVSSCFPLSLHVMLAGTKYCLLPGEKPCVAEVFLVVQGTVTDAV